MVDLYVKTSLCSLTSKYVKKWLLLNVLNYLFGSKQQGEKRLNNYFTAKRFLNQDVRQYSKFKTILHAPYSTRGIKYMTILNNFLRRCDPFVLYYTKLELVMNFSVYGNDARFIRRSCSPTAEVCL